MTSPVRRLLDVSTPDDRSIVVTRDFPGSPEAVWRAHTEPDALRQWLGRADFPLSTCEMDVRVGGVYRWVFTRVDGGPAMRVSGTFDEVSPYDRLVTTERFDDFPGPSVNTMVLTPLEQDRQMVSGSPRVAPDPDPYARRVAATRPGGPEVGSIMVAARPGGSPDRLRSGEGGRNRDPSGLEPFGQVPSPAPSHGERTRLILTLVYPTRAIRDSWLGSGMTDGMSEGYERLDALLGAG